METHEPVHTEVSADPGPAAESAVDSRRLAMMGAAGVLIAVAVVGALDVWTFNWPRSPITRTISEYAQGPLWWPFYGAVLLLAVGSLAILMAMVRQRLTRPLSAGAVAVALWSLGLTFVVLFEKHDWSQGPSMSGYIHQLASLTAFISLPVAGVLLARPWRGHDRWRVAARWTSWLGVISMLWFVPILGAVVLSIATEIAWWQLVPLGLTERALVLTEILVLLAMARWSLAAGAEQSRPRD